MARLEAFDELKNPGNGEYGDEFSGDDGWRFLQFAIDFPAMGDTDHEDQYLLLLNSVDNDIILPCVNTTKFRLAFQLPCFGPPGILGQQIKPSHNPLLDMTREVGEFPASLWREFDAVGHDLKPQFLLNLFQGNGLLP